MIHKDDAASGLRREGPTAPRLSTVDALLAASVLMWLIIVVGSVLVLHFGRHIP